MAVDTALHYGAALQRLASTVTQYGVIKLRGSSFESANCAVALANPLAKHAKNHNKVEKSSLNVVKIMKNVCKGCKATFSKRCCIF